MDAYDYLNFVAWIKDSKRQPAIFAFTAGEVRDAAYAVEQSGILAQFAAEASAVEVLGKVKKAIADQGLELVEEGGEYRLEFQQVASISFNTDWLKLLTEAEQQGKEK